MDSAFLPSQLPPPGEPPGPRTRPLTEHPDQAAQAIELLRTPLAIKGLSPEEARVVVAHMRAVSFPAGTVVMREGDRAHTGYLLLILEGDVSVETDDGTGGGEAVPVSVVGPGSLIGEMALLDGAPRSVNCVAISRVDAGGLSREALARMMDEHPKVAARLMAGIAQRLADRLRATDHQLRLYAHLTADLQSRLKAAGC